MKKTHTSHTEIRPFAKRHTLQALLTAGAFLTSGLVSQAQEVVAGTANPLADLGGADDWSGIVLLTTPIGAPDGAPTLGRVITFNYFVDDVRLTQVENGEHTVTPLLVESEVITGDDNVETTKYTVIGVGSDHVPLTDGPQSVDFGLIAGRNVIETTTEGRSYHVALLQQRNTSGEDFGEGVVSFDVDSTSGPGVILDNLSDSIVVNPGDDVENEFPGGGGASTRDYAFNFIVDFTPTTDSDSDGMDDAYEDANGLDKTDPSDAASDRDGDLLSNLQEFERFTDPNNSDTDGDGLNDGVESDTGDFVDKDSDTGTSPLRKDTDGDGYDDDFETNSGIWVGLIVDMEDTGTDPLNPDTDGDGLRDGLESNTGIFVDRETDTGTNPLDDDSDDDGSEDGLEVISGFSPTDPSSVRDGKIAGEQPIVAGGMIDAWTHFVYFDESRILDLNGTTGLVTGRFKFDTSITPTPTGRVTPIFAEVVAPNEFIIRAIGTTRVGGVDWTENGPQDFAFSDAGEVPVEDGWIAGIATYDPNDPAEGGSPIAFEGGSGVDGWMTGSAVFAENAPVLIVGQAPGEGATATDGGAFGERTYDFQITAATPSAELEVTSIALDDGIEEVTLTWGSVLRANYRIFYSTDLADGFTQEIGGLIPSQGESSQFLFANPSPGAPKLFFRVVLDQTGDTP